jgi:UDP-3-O-[3-hydroxymyristoyl] glucosamine N-acyltransferase
MMTRRSSASPAARASDDGRALHAAMPPKFFKKAGPFALSELAGFVGGKFEGAGNKLFHDVRSLGEAGDSDISFFENRKYLDAFTNTKAGACLVAEQFAAQCPKGTIPLIVDVPNAAYGELLAHFYPDATRPQLLFGTGHAYSFVHPTAKVAKTTAFDPGVVIGPGAMIGENCTIAAQSVIGPGVVIGANTHIAAGCVVQHAVLGDNVVIHPGVKIGQDGFGYVFSKSEHKKIPQVGRVIIGSNVEIGANTTVDRGSLRDTMIGEGTKIDNLVQIGHNVVIGRHCVIVGQVGISGSVTLKDFVMIGGQSSVAGHVTIHEGAQIAAVSTVKDDVPAGGRYGGTPAKPVKQWFREMAALSRLAARSKE